MVRLLWSPPLLIGLATAWWIGLGSGGLLLFVAALLERFFYSQRMGDSVETGGEAGPLGQLHFVSVLAYSSMLVWALFPWEILPEGLIASEWLPQVQSPFTTDWWSVIGLDTAPVENPLEPGE